MQFLCKFINGANYSTCNEFFVVGKSIMFLVLHEFVYAINYMYRGLIYLLKGLAMILVMEKFMELCGLPNIKGVINGTHISITKPQGGFIKDYYYHKTRGYSVMAQIMVDT